MVKKHSKNKKGQVLEVFESKPDWYWNGLHDASILAVNRLTLQPDFRSPIEQRHWNCLEICIDARWAMFDSTVRKISLYNYKILAGDLLKLNEKDVWWIGDELSRKGRKGGYTLKIVFETYDGDVFEFEIQFTDAKVERKGY